jgi:signal transduction histidine kinase/HPt (histidine-containing phosphotransfer) domain-containing protein
MKTIFIVDDNDVNRITAKNALDGYYISYAIPSAQNMFKLAEKITPDLILLDVEMPDMNGFEAITRIKNDKNLNHVPIIFLTGKNDSETETLGFEMGAVDFINKPFSQPVLLKRIELHLETMRLINEINNAKKTAEDANLAKSKFLAAMSHDIRTPLNAIIGISEIKLERDDLNDDTKMSFNRIYNSGHMLLGIINDILDLSKIETGKLELDPIRYKTTHLINDTVHLNVMRIEEKPINFNVKVAETLPLHLFGDELRIKQVLNNLLSNAIKYTAKGTVTLEVDSQTIDNNKCSLIFTIKDTGQGMTPEQLNKIYDEYSQFNRAKNRNTEGTGLGMSITKSLVEMMDGKLLAKSEPNVGSTFTVYLTQQWVDDEVVGKETSENLQNFKYAEKTYRTKIDREYMPYGRVFVIDDVEANVFVTTALLKAYGLQIDSATNGYDAVEKIRSGEVYDIVFMDHMMPGMDGIEATHMIRNLGYTRPVIALTANAIKGQKEFFLENQFDDYISKPIDLYHLDALLNQLIRDKKPADVVEKARKNKDKNRTAVVNENAFLEPLNRLKQIEILNVNNALELLDNDIGAFIQTVKLFARLAPQTLDKTDKYITEHKIKDFTTEIHGLKGAMRNIGAVAIANNAALLEDAGLVNNISFCETHYPPFRAEMNAFITQLQEALVTETINKKPADPSILLIALPDAINAAQCYDNMTALTTLRPFIEFTFGETVDVILQDIINALEVFDCGDALEYINKLNKLLSE